MAENVMSACCRECPFKRTSAQGWLGSASSPEDFLFPHWHGKLRLACHMRVDWESDEAQEQALDTAPLCRGILIMSKNCAKHLDNEEMARARSKVSPDVDAVFRFALEFTDHHSK